MSATYNEGCSVRMLIVGPDALPIRMGVSGSGADMPLPRAWLQPDAHMGLPAPDLVAKARASARGWQSLQRFFQARMQLLNLAKELAA